MQLEEQAARLGVRAVPGQLLAEAQADLDALAQSIDRRQCAPGRPAGRDRPHAPRDRGAGRGEPGRAGRADRRARAQDLPRRADRPTCTEAMTHAGGRDPARSTRETRDLLAQHLQHRSTSTSAACSPSCSAAATPGW
ncbi:MAG: hypothetical protein MZW92_33820 [Comamonadaceae bacterium]|nr:hypothetical protein [Comamonadaceae bacterium]